MVQIFSIVCSGTCGSSFTTAHGHMSSPSYPNNYPGNDDCIYTVSESTGTVILLNFLSMDIHKYSWDSSCDYDYLEIRDGPSDDSPLLDKLCGSEIPAPIQSTQNQLWMKWGEISVAKSEVKSIHLIVISDSTLMMETKKRDFTSSTTHWNCSLHVEEASQIPVESWPHPHTQINTQNWQTVSTSSLSPMEHMSTSPSSTWI